MRRVFVATALVALGGCATVSTDDPNAAFVAARAEAFRSCSEGTPAVTRAALGTRLANVAGVRASLEMLADTTIPSAEEKQAISALAEQRDRCRLHLADVHDRFGHGAVGSIFRASFPAVRATYAELYAGAISYGTANKRLEEIEARVAEEIGAYGRALDAQEAQLAEQRRLAAVQMFQQWNLSTRPITTNCVRIGLQTQCTTR